MEPTHFIMKPELPHMYQIARTHDNTMMSALDYCNRRYGLAHVRCKRPMGSSAALKFGGLMHIGLDNYYKRLAAGDSWQFAHNAALDSMADQEYEDPFEDYRTKGRALLVMSAYANERGFDEELTTHMTETPFDITDADGFRWGGIMDWLGDYNTDVWPMDHKTTSRFGAYYFDDFKRDPQMIGYTYAGGLLRGAPVPGVLINVIAVRKRDHEFARRPMHYPQWLIDEWKVKMVQQYERAEHIRELVEKNPESVWQPTAVNPNLYNCIGKYGRCPFFDVCESRPENRERVLRIEYETHEWNWAERDD
jgi:hypothetical protein